MAQAFEETQFQVNQFDAVLWSQLSNFRLDDPSHVLTFSERATKENGWTPAFTKRAVAEYKCFLYLAVTCPHVVCPSEAVDQVWHMHLTYTRSYWDDLCGAILGRPLHHGPTKGGRAEHEKYFKLYRKTLAAYQQTFQCQPPSDIWPSAEKRFGEDLGFVRINANRHWIIPKPKRAQAIAGTAGAVLLIPLAQLAANPLNWHGPTFLALYLSLLVVATLASWLGRKWVLMSGESYNFTPGGADAIGPVDVAWLQGGAPRAISCALVELAQKNAVTLEGDLICPGPGIGTARADHRVSDLILNSVSAAPAGCTYGLISRDANVGIESLKQNLNDKGLLIDWSQRAAAMALPLALLGGLSAFGVAKAFVGLQRDKPVGFLILAIVATLATLLVFALTLPKLTSAGKELLSKLRKDVLADPKKLLPPQVADPSLADNSCLLWSTALLGTAALASTSWMDFDSFLNRQIASGAGSSSGGCGTSGCGGDSGCGGGGGCGGGCGGCGGD